MERQKKILPALKENVARCVHPPSCTLVTSAKLRFEEWIEGQRIPGASNPLATSLGSGRSSAALSTSTSIKSSE